MRHPASAASSPDARCAANSARRPEGRADGVDHDERPHRRARGEHHGCRADPAAQPPGARAGAGADRALRHRPGGGGAVGRGAVGRARDGCARPPPRPRSNSTAAGTMGTRSCGLRPDRPAAAGGRTPPPRPRRPPPARRPCRRRARRRRPRRPVAGVEQVGLAGARPAAAHVDAADRAGRWDDDGDPGEPPGLVTGGVADEHAGDVGDRVRAVRAARPSMTDAGPAGAGPASGSGRCGPQCSRTAGATSSAVASSSRCDSSCLRGRKNAGMSVSVSRIAATRRSC